MDEEDLAELAADRKLVDTTEELDLGPADAVAGAGDPENECAVRRSVVIPS
jgi:hypothetical protein